MNDVFQIDIYIYIYIYIYLFSVLNILVELWCIHTIKTCM
jgi:hypothetical protein